MRDEQPGSEQPAASAQAGSPAGDHWGDPITPERQAELKELADQQPVWAAAPDHQGRESYFRLVRLTGADVFWLAAYALAGPEGDVAAAQERLRTARDRREYIDLSALHLEGAIFDHQAHLEGATLGGAHLERADLFWDHLEGAFLAGTHLEGAVLAGTHLEGAVLDDAHLEGAFLYVAHLEGAFLREAHLEGKTYQPDDAELARIRQWVQRFPATLPPADLRGVFLNAATNLGGIHLGDTKGGTVQVADVRWGGVNLAVVDWTPFTDKKAVLGDEQEAWDWQAKPFTETEKQRKRPRQERTQARAKHVAQQDRERLAAFQAGVRANRQVATVLRDQGMNEEADYFAYRAQLLQRQVFHLQGKRGRRLGSLLLDLVSGYGYKPRRSVITYLLVVALFGLVYWALGVATGHTLTWNEAAVVSLTAFHGRGFFATAFLPGDPQAALAAIEAVIGLLIEITFIATFTQRFFAR